MAGDKEEMVMDDPGVVVQVIDETKGKGLFACKSFKEGEILFEERPLVCCQFAWNIAYEYAACDYCMRPLEGAEENARRLSSDHKIVLPYPQCCPVKKEQHSECSVCKVKYCSSECRQLAWNQYHQVLCYVPEASHPLEQLNEAWKHMHYPPETATIMLLARMIATVRQARDKEGALHLFMQFCHRTKNEEEEIAHKLLGEKFESQLHILRDLMKCALYDPCVEQWFDADGFKSLFALVGTNSQGVGTSPLSQWVKNTETLDVSEDEKEKLNVFIDKLYGSLEDESGGFLNNEGSALYALQSACNHSCVPNAQATFPYGNFQLVMVALKDIKAGEEICVSYLEDCMLTRSRHSRHSILRENYLFVCHCPKCEEQAGDPDVTSESSYDSECEEEN